MLVDSATLVVVSIKVDTFDSVVPVVKAVVKDEDSCSVDDEVVKMSWQIGPL